MSLPRGAQFRLIAFSAGIAVLLGLIGWAATMSWRQFAEMEHGIREEELGSFQIADAFQANINRLNYTLVRLGTEETIAERQRFEQQSRELNQWLDQQKAFLTTRREREVLERIDRAYDYYLVAARNVIAVAERTNDPKLIFDALQESARTSQPLLELGYALASANQEARRQWRGDLRHSLTSLQIVIFAALVCLLAFGVGTGTLIYRQLIGPLRLQLAESRELVARQEKLASLGILAAGVAHEIRNPLTAIKVRLFTLRKELGQAASDTEDLNVISAEINRLDRIVKDFLQFARPSEPNLQKIRSQELLNEVRDLMAEVLSERAIDVQVDASNDGEFLGDPQQLKQVLINLMRNAADAVGRKGRVVLRARNGNEIINKQRHRCVCIEVEDDGCGIPVDVQKRLFDPFFSTKEAGTGLGLPIAARIVERHGGVLKFDTRINKGTTFIIMLPVTDL